MPFFDEPSVDWKLEDFANAYRNWIYTRMLGKGYGILFDVLHDTKFEWDVSRLPRDGDRAVDGQYLRLRFADEAGWEFEDEWLEWPCSFLEFLVALAFSIEDSIMYDPAEPNREHEWFWLMMHNIGLDKFDDEYMLSQGTMAMATVSDICEMVMDRDYDYNGAKGLFPLRNPVMDQRGVEIWYQANAYFIEEYFE